MRKALRHLEKRAAAFAGLMFLAACGTTSEQPGGVRIVAKTPEFAVVQANGHTDSAIANALFGDAGKSALVQDAARQYGLRSGNYVTVPLKPVNRSSVYHDGYQVIPVLCYHQFGAGDRARNPMEVSENNFRRQLAYLRDNGYRVISFAELADFLSGDKPVPRKAVVITIDDGYSSSYSVAYPLLREFNYPATIFVYSDFAGRGGAALTWDQMREMEASGLIDIQSHSKSHPSLSPNPGEAVDEEYRARVRQEIRVPDRILREKLGQPVTHFAYPFGDTSDVVIAELQSARYELAATVQRGGNPSYASPLILRRSMIYAGDSVDKFARQIDGFVERNLK